MDEGLSPSPSVPKRTPKAHVFFGFAGDFTKTHSFHKPTKRQQIIFYCRSGKRSATAMDLAKRAGYKGLVSLSLLS